MHCYKIQGNESLIISANAIFGLCRKNSAGKSVRAPLSGTTVFEPQDDVNAVVASQVHYSQSTSTDHEVS